MKVNRKIPVAAPALIGNERKYVLDCLETSWISSNGEYIGRFEKAFAEFCGTRNALACANGTVALHVALLGLGVEAGDEVIVPSLTYVATANAVSYCGATPVLVDSEPVTWNMDPSQIEDLITPRTKGIIVVHLFGHPVDMDPIMQIAERHGLFVLEDAAEAHGANRPAEDRAPCLLDAKRLLGRGRLDGAPELLVGEASLGDRRDPVSLGDPKTLIEDGA